MRYVLYIHADSLRKVAEFDARDNVDACVKIITYLAQEDYNRQPMVLRTISEERSPEPDGRP